MSREPMSKWYDRAWVRKARLTYDVSETITGPVHFSPKLVSPLRRTPWLLDEVKHLPASY